MCVCEREREEEDEEKEKKKGERRGEEEGFFLVTRAMSELIHIKTRLIAVVPLALFQPVNLFI